MASFKHPEQRAGEAFLGNTVEGLFSQIRWKTKRLGSTAYGTNGQMIPAGEQISPVFVQRQELLAAGVDPDLPLDR
ncbi:MAG: hypothetical protein ACOZBH_00580 [Patescibacteria group bacterium]